jgi:hypothetical protein
MRFLLLAILALSACDPTYLDEGLMVREGLTLHVDGPVGISGEFAEEVSQWWNEQCGETLFYSPTPTPDATIEFGYVADPHELGNLGIAAIEYSRIDGLITFCEITISSDIAYHEETALEVAKHEAGHCLGLDDDPNSLDLNSIMASPSLYRGQVTPGDCELVTAWSNAE